MATKKHLRPKIEIWEEDPNNPGTFIWVDRTTLFKKFGVEMERETNELVRFGDMLKMATKGFYSGTLAVGLIADDDDAMDAILDQFENDDGTKIRWTYDKTKPVAADNRQMTFEVLWSFPVFLGGEPNARAEKDGSFRINSPVTISIVDGGDPATDRVIAGA